MVILTLKGSIWIVQQLESLGKEQTVRALEAYWKYGGIERIYQLLQLDISHNCILVW
jgi:hypothetical protein